MYRSFSGQRVTSRRADDPAAALFLEVNAGDQDIGSADPNRDGGQATRLSVIERRVQPEINLGTGGDRFGHKRDGGRLYASVTRYQLAQFK